MNLPLSTVRPEDHIQPLVHLWNACAGDEFPLDARLLSQQLALDTDERRCFTALADDGTLAGAILAKRAGRPNPDGTIPSLGYVSILAVAPSHRRQGLGTALLREASAWLASLGATRVRLGADHYHLLPGLPVTGSAGSDSLAAFCRRHGFADEGTEYDVIADLETYVPEQVVPVADTVVVPWNGSQPERVLAFMRSNFPGRWSQDMEEAITAGMRHTDLLLATDTRSGAITGFARIYDRDSTVLGPGVYWRGIMGDRPGGLGPIGIDRARRGAGLGLYLLRAGMNELHRRGVRTMVIDWTDLLDFYGKMGCRVWKQYRTASMQLGGE